MLYSFAAAGPHISIKAQPIFTIGSIPVTNSHLLGLLGLIIMVWLLFATRAVALGRKKPNFTTRLTLWTFEGLYTTVKQVVPEEKWAHRLAPLTITMFFFVIAQYWMGLLPFVGSPITVGEDHIPLLRGGVADLNMTFALAFITIIGAQIYAIWYMGLKANLGRYLYNPFTAGPIMTFVGILEIIAELSRLMSLSFRLFGNVVAGEILLAMITYLTQFLAPVTLQPFYIFELFIGGIQAYIFFMLSTVFISLGLSHHGDDEKQTATEPLHPTPVVTAAVDE